MRQNLPNQDPSKYAEEGYCVFYDFLSIDEMKPYQQTLDGPRKWKMVPRSLYF